MSNVIKDIKVAIIGCGRIAGHHCRSVVKVEGMMLVAVCDLDSTKADAYSKEFNVPGYTNYREMLTKHSEVDLVAIMTPSGMHFEHAKEIVSDFKKHVIIEKPTFLKLNHIKNIHDLAAKAGVNVFPVFQNRYNHAVRRVKQALDSGELGDIRIFSIRVRWCRPQTYYDLSAWRGTFAMDGGAITNQGIHHVDLMRHLGGEVESVTSQMRTLGAEIEVEDTCVATFNYSSGAVGTLEITTAARPDDFEASISIVGSKGLAQIGGIAVNELQVFTPNATATKEFSEDFSKCVYGNGHEMLYRDIVKHFKGTEIYPVSQQDALETIKLLHSFYVSSERNVPVSPKDELESARLGEPCERLAQLYRIKEKSL